MSYSKKEFLKETRPLCKKLIKYAMEEGKGFGITDIRVSISVSEKQKNEVESGEVSEVSSGLTCKAAITIYAGDRVLSFVQESLDEDILRKAIKDNMEIIHLVPENKNKRLLEKEKLYKGKDKDLDLYDEAASSQDDLINYAKALEAAALGEKGIKTTRSTSVTKNASHFLAMATNGLDINESSTSFQAVTQAIAENESGMQVDYDYSMARHFADMASPENLGKKAAQNALAKLDAIMPSTGEMPIILNHDAARTFFAAVYSSINGTEIHRGTSFMKGKIGKQVMSDKVTIIDTPLIERGLNSGTVDGTGMEAKDITFIEKGILKSYMINLREARQLGLEPIGRSGRQTNTSILPGDKNPNELMADIKEGIYIKGFNGGTVDVNNGTHSRQAYGNLIKNGKITDIAVDGFVVSGNLKEMFMNVVLADDTPSHPNTRSSFAAPTTRINKVTIAGK